MRKLSKIYILFLLFPIAAMSQETKIQLTEKVSISFPDKPDVRNMQDIATVYSLKLADSTANFNVVVQNLEKNGLTAELIESAKLEPEFWKQLESSFLAQLGNEVKVLSKERRNIGNMDILSLVLNTQRNGKEVEISAYIFTQSVYSFTMAHSKRSDNASQDVKNKFFNSLKILD
ncbi:MAG: hypothetical protein ACK48G_08140 [Chitinophagaceae bacterium]|jgi:hypothetical protein